VDQTGKAIVQETTGRGLRLPAIAAAALLAIHALLAAHTAWRKSATVDEVGHLPAGISYWQTGSFELYHHNPPLVKLLAALPALTTQPIVDYSSWEINRKSGMPLSPWAFGWEFMYANAVRYHTIYFWSRLPIVAFSLLAGAIVFMWARAMFGDSAGVVAVALWAFCPNVIAHGSLVTTDMGATSLGFVATYVFWQYLRQPSWRLALLAGLCLGLAELTKFSLLMLYVLWPAIWLGYWALGGARPLARSVKRSIAQLAATCVVSIAIINAGYFFEGTGTKLGDFQFLSRTLTRKRTTPPPPIPQEHPWLSVILHRENRFAGSWLGELPVPLPREYVAGFDEQKLESEGIDGQGYPVYLRGVLRRTGWWWYYFYALAVKVPVGTWLLTGLALATALVRPGARGSRGDEFVLIVPPLATLLALSFLTDINLGLRYVLAVFPFWFVLVSRVACWFDSRNLPAFVTLVALAWNVARCLWIHPHHLATFNEFVGGPKNGYRHLIDSNLDWGQDLLELERWLARNRPGERVHLAYFGNVDPSILAASGRPIEFSLAPPGQLESLRLVALKARGELFYERGEWIQQHEAELLAWMRSQQAMGRNVAPNDHPAIRAMAFEKIGLTNEPQAGLYAISANFLVGLPFRLRDQDGNMWNAVDGAYSYLQGATPIDQVGYSIFIFELSEEQARRLR
jgi:4-amino-4-deoxy-L-arabinose transferase-like glycosyltransferase